MENLFAGRMAEIFAKPDGFGDSCVLMISEDGLAAMKNGVLRISLRKIGPLPKIEGFCLRIDCNRGNFSLNIGGDGASCEIAKGVRGKWSVNMWRGSSLRVGEKTTANECRIVLDKSTVTIGSDCMISDGVLIQSADQHAIVDLSSGKIVNDESYVTDIQDHVWLGRNCMILSDLTIGRGAIVGAAAVVTKDIPEYCAAVGVPAKVVRRRVTWSRSMSSLDAFSRESVEAFSRGEAGNDG